MWLPKCVFLYAFVVLLDMSEALKFTLEGGAKKCLKHDPPPRTITKGQYEATPHPSHTIKIIVKDPKDHLLYQQAAISKGSFAFTTEEYNFFMVCFISDIVPGERNVSPREIFLDIKEGAETKNFELNENAEKLKPMEVELSRLEALTNEVVRDFDIMHTRSATMRSTNESTHTRVLYFSILSMIILIGFACWQVLYLRRYFKSKKLIE